MQSLLVFQHSRVLIVELMVSQTPSKFELISRFEKYVAEPTLNPPCKGGIEGGLSLKLLFCCYAFGIFYDEWSYKCPSSV